jgi:hypothetical protein
MLAQLTHLKELEYVSLYGLLESKQLHSTVMPTMDTFPWKKLAVQYYPDARALENILIRISSTIAHLEMSLDSLEDLSIVIVHSNQMACLKSLSVAIRRDAGSFEFIKDITKPSIEEFSFQYNPIIGADNDKLPEIFDFFTIWVSQVQVLKLHVHGDLKPVLDYAFSLSKLRIASLDLSSSIRSQQLKYFEEMKDTLRAEKLSFGSLGIFLPIKITGVSQLDIYKLDSSGLQVNPWSDLRILSINSMSGRWRHLSLPRVEKITLAAECRVSNLCDALFFLCEDIAQNPSLLPALECIQTEVLPEWDI